MKGSYILTIGMILVLALSSQPVMAYGGGGGDGAITPPAIHGIPAGISYTYDLPMMPHEGTISVSREGLDITKLWIRMDSNVYNFRLVATQMATTLLPKPAEKVASYFDVRAAGSFVDVNIKEAAVTFKVAKQWIEVNDIDPLTIMLQRYDGGWIPLDTVYQSEDGEYRYYRASTGEFSIFAVTGEAKEEVVTPTIVPTAEVTSTRTGIWALNESETPEEQPGFGAIIGVLSLFAAVYLYRKR